MSSKKGKSLTPEMLKLVTIIVLALISIIIVLFMIIFYLISGNSATSSAGDSTSTDIAFITDTPTTPLQPQNNASPPTSTIMPTSTINSQPTYTPFPTLAPLPTYTSFPTRIPTRPAVVVRATATPISNFPAGTITLVSPTDNVSIPSTTQFFGFQWWYGTTCNRPPNNLLFELRIWRDGSSPQGAMDAKYEQDKITCDKGLWGYTLGNLTLAPGISGGTGAFKWDVALVRVDPYQVVETFTPLTLNLSDGSSSSGGGSGGGSGSGDGGCGSSRCR